MYIKAVYSYITRDTQSHSSLTISPYSLEYFTTRWTEPMLKGSGIFVFQDLKTTLLHYPRPQIKQLPYHGITFWWVYTQAPKKIYPIKDPPSKMIEEYWHLYKLHLAPQSCDKSIPWVYRFRQIPEGIFISERVMLSHMVMNEEYGGLNNIEAIDW